MNAEHTDARAASVWAASEITWGLFGVPETEIGALGDVTGLDVIELGCGTAYFSAWLARRGARPVGVDLTPAQLETARGCQREFGIDFPLVEADATAVPLPDASFDVVISEYGASVWCDPERWIAEAARLLRPTGRLVFLTNSVLATLCVPAEEGETQAELLRPQRDFNRVHWPGGGIEFHPSHSTWIRILRANGFAIEALHELYTPAGATDPDYYSISNAEWAAQWPVEDLWVARRGRVGLMLFAFLCALVATVSYGVGTVLQASGALRAAGSDHLDIKLLGRLAHQGPYIGGLALDAVGFVAAATALQTLPLFVVQAAVAGSLGVTAALAPFVFGFKLTTSVKVAIVVLLAGLVLLAASAAGEEAADISELGEWLLLGGVAVVIAAGAISARSGHNSGIALAACAGFAFAGSAVAARALIVPSALVSMVRDPVAIALVAYGVCGIFLFASALQRGAVTPISAVMLAVETIVPAAIGFIALGDRTRPNFEVVAAVGFAATIGACFTLARYAEPDDLVDGDRAG